MEVLNKNQRETATWRLLGFGLLVLAVIAAILFSSYKDCGNKGSGEEEKLRRQIKVNDMTAQGKEEGLQNRVKALEAEVNKFKAENSNLKTDNNTLKNEYRLLETRNKNVEKDLDRCLISKTNGNGG